MSKSAAAVMPAVTFVEETRAIPGQLYSVRDISFRDRGGRLMFADYVPATPQHMTGPAIAFEISDADADRLAIGEGSRVLFNDDGTIFIAPADPRVEYEAKLISYAAQLEVRRRAWHYNHAMNAVAIGWFLSVLSICFNLRVLYETGSAVAAFGFASAVLSMGIAWMIEIVNAHGSKHPKAWAVLWHAVPLFMVASYLAALFVVLT